MGNDGKPISEWIGVSYSAETLAVAVAVAGCCGGCGGVQELSAEQVMVLRA